MSSSVETNQGLRESRAGPNTNLEVSQIFDTPSSSSTGPYMLAPVGDLKKIINLDVKKELLRKVMYPHLCKVMEASGFAYESGSLEEDSWTLLEANAVPESITSTLINVCRRLDRKGKEWLTWTVVLRGTDKHGESVVGNGTVVEYGKDFEPEIKSIRNL